MPVLLFIELSYSVEFLRIYYSRSLDAWLLPVPPNPWIYYYFEVLVFRFLKGEGLLKEDLLELFAVKFIGKLSDFWFFIFKIFNNINFKFKQTLIF